MSAGTRSDRDAITQQIKKIVDKAPPLTDDQRAILAAVFGTPPPPGQDGDRAQAA